MRRFKIKGKWFNAHVHWRQRNTILDRVAPFSVNNFSGSLLMPNTQPPIDSYAQHIWYRTQVENFLKENNYRHHIMHTYYLSPALSLEDLKRGWESGSVHAVKYYPKGGTTGSADGLDGFKAVMPLLEYMQEVGMPLLIHGEIPIWNGVVVDDFEREPLFIKEEGIILRESLPELPMTMEHITTADAVEFVERYPKYTRATITPQHVSFDRRVTRNGCEATDHGYEYNQEINGFRPDFECRPVIQSEANKLAIQKGLIRQAENGSKLFGLGTDSAAHEKGRKYASSCACGMFTEEISHALYATAFDEMGILDHYRVFACEVMPEFYGITDKLADRTLILQDEPMLVAAEYGGIVPPFAGQTLPWSAKWA